MNKTLLACCTLAMLAMLRAPDAAAQDTYHGGATDARQHGYEHGYRDGFSFGQQNAQVSNRDQDIVNQKLRQADKDYQPAFGAQDAYRQGYADGFRTGMEDGRAGNRSKLEELFRARDPNYDPDRRADDRIDGIYPQNRWPASHAANDIGYRDGFAAGQQDRRDGRSYQPRQHAAWQKASHGNEGGYGSQSQYRSAYRTGFEQGYRDGFGRGR